MEGLQEGGGLETVAMTQRQKVKLQVADLKFLYGVTKRDRIRMSRSIVDILEKTC